MSSPDPASKFAAPLSWIDAEAQRLVDLLVEVSGRNSGSFNVDGVNDCGTRMCELFAPLGAVAESIEVAPFRYTDDRGEWQQRPLGRAIRLRKRPKAPLRIFLCGHLDTVFAVDHPFQKTVRSSDDTLNGPGVADLKGGLLAMYLALAALERSGDASRIGWEVLFNPDEEIGSRGSAPLLAEAATRNHLGLIYEPAFFDGALAGERKGSGNFDIVVNGRAAHAGRNPEEGRNAIVAAAHMAVALQALNGERGGLTVNVGYVHGGGSLNIVPDRCVVKFNVRTTAADDEPWLLARVGELIDDANRHEGYALELRGGFTRPAKPVTAGTARLQGLLADCGSALGIELQFRPTGGCCDGNNLAAAGLPNVDNLGVVGGEIHSDREWMRCSSLAERAKLSALLLLRLASGELQWQG